MMMKRLLLVDDELLARQHIRETFPWAEWGYEIAGEATNGVEALAMSEQLDPDIALIDITMPVMDGLALLKHMSSRHPRTKCIILTAHREFSFAKQALENGAVGYILKAPVDLGETKAALDRALLESEKDLRLLSGSRDHSTIRNHQYPLRKHLFQQLLTGVYAADEEIIRQGQAIGAHLQASPQLLLVCEADRLHRFQARYSDSDRSLIEFSLLEIIRESLEELLPGQVELFPLHFGRVVLLLFPYADQRDREGYVELCTRLDRAIQPMLHKYLDLQLVLAASEPFSHPRQIRGIYKQTEELLIHRFYQERPRPIFAYCAQPFVPAADDRLTALRQLAEPLAREEQPEGTRVKCLVRIQAAIAAAKLQPSRVTGWFHSLRSLFTDGAASAGWPDYASAVSLYDAVQLLEDWLGKRDRLLAAAVAARPEIARSLQFIREHIGDELTLESISRESGLSTSHFSHLFRKELGMSVIDYVLEQRIELAKQYLAEGKYRNYELAEKVGFQHYSYFSNMFKKLTGISPNDYRRSVKQVVPGPEH
ncbi:MAG: hypothetical protein K0R57_276 [Paenibacillaceae bacterium]|jgi:AraC-like DNA-binding protein/DNA-binding NarL/FixJ family response regulator|nr:hypothetical protein [Paenibacillaceae bacterium]